MIKTIKRLTAYTLVAIFMIIGSAALLSGLGASWNEAIGLSLFLWGGIAVLIGFVILVEWLLKT